MNYTQLQAALHRANIAMPLPWGMPTLQPTAFCCSSCVGAALVDIMDGSNYTGAIWFNEQAGDHPADVYCSWASASDGQSVDYAGHLVDILTHLGLDTEWDGSPNKCIRLRGVDGSDFRSWVAVNTPDDDDDWETSHTH